MLKIWKKLMILLDKRQKRQMILMVPLMLLSAALEMASLLLVMAVITVIATPEGIESNKIASALYNGLNFTGIKSFSIAVMVSLIVAYILKNVYLFFQWKIQYAFVYRNQFMTSEKMLRSYLNRDYEYFLFADTAVVQRSITSDVNNMYGLILSILTIVSELFVSLTLVIYLFVVDPVMCLVIGALLLITMFAITKILKPVMKKSGQDNQDFYAGLFKWISQIVQGIKELKVSRKERYFVNEYKKCGTGYVNAVERYSLYNNTPKLLIETVCVTGMIGFFIYTILSGQNVSSKLSVIGGFAYAAIKLMPSANKINNQLNAISYFEPFLMNVSDKLQDYISDSKTDITYLSEDVERLDIKKGIYLKNIKYRYPQTERYILDNASMDVPIGCSVGIVGSSGAGKTTVVDILLGLLKPEAGGVYADETNTNDEYRSWLKNVGYIPQMIYMIDGSIRQNVAFGVSDEDIDEKRVWECLEEAQLADYIKSLPEGLDTQIGERGVRISGGQRQRIGIARALYNDPEVLILDEATSALDNDTEAAIMESVNALHGKKTLIIIAHRLQTIEKCDMVYRIENGRITRER